MISSRATTRSRQGIRRSRRSKARAPIATSSSPRTSRLARRCKVNSVKRTLSIRGINSPSGPSLPETNGIVPALSAALGPLGSQCSALEMAQDRSEGLPRSDETFWRVRGGEVASLASLRLKPYRRGPEDRRRELERARRGRAACWIKILPTSGGEDPRAAQAHPGRLSQPPISFLKWSKSISSPFRIVDQCRVSAACPTASLISPSVAPAARAASVSAKTQ